MQIKTFNSNVENVKYGCLGKSSSVNRGRPCPVVPRIYELEPDDIPELLQTCKSFVAFFGDIRQDLIFPEKRVVLL